MNTECANERTRGISNAETENILRMINDEDATVAGVVKECIPQIAKLVDAAVIALNDGGRIIYCGCGTSGRLGVVDAAECPPTYGVPNNLVIGVIAGGINAIVNAAEGCEDSKERGIEAFYQTCCKPEDVVIGISAAGHAAFVVAFMEEAKKIGCVTGAITNNKNTTLARIADIAVEACTGSEVIKGSTRMKAGTAQKMILNSFSTAVFIKYGCTFENYMVNMKPSNEKLKKRAISMVMEITGVNEEKATIELVTHDWNIKNTLTDLYYKFESKI